MYFFGILGELAKPLSTLGLFLEVSFTRLAPWFVVVRIGEWICRMSSVVIPFTYG